MEPYSEADVNLPVGLGVCFCQVEYIHYSEWPIQIEWWGYRVGLLLCYELGDFLCYFFMLEEFLLFVVIQNWHHKFSSALGYQSAIHYFVVIPPIGPWLESFNYIIRSCVWCPCTYPPGFLWQMLPPGWGFWWAKAWLLMYFPWNPPEEASISHETRRGLLSCI